MKYFNNISTKLSWLLLLIECVALFVLMFGVIEAVLFLKTRFYDTTTFALNIIFYLSPIIGLLLAREMDSEVFFLGVVSLSVFTIFIDFMYLAHLFQHSEELGVVQWLYIIPAALVTFINYQLIRRARIHRYCPSCQAKINLKQQNFCHNCGIDLLHYHKG